MIPPTTRRITQLFGKNPQIYKQFGMKGHNGIDYGTPNGDPIKASYGGTVTEVGYSSGGYGRYIRMRGSGKESVYGHLQQTLVKKGQGIKEGQLIAKADNTGFSTGPHLHFGVRYYDWRGSIKDYNNGYYGYVDPLPLFKKPKPKGKIPMLKDVGDATIWKLLDMAGARVNETSKKKEPKAKAEWLKAYGNKNLEWVVDKMWNHPGLKKERNNKIDAYRVLDRERKKHKTEIEKLNKQIEVEKAKTAKCRKNASDALTFIDLFKKLIGK